MVDIADKGGRGSSKDLLRLDLSEIEARMFALGMDMGHSRNMPWPQAFHALHGVRADCVILDEWEDLVGPVKPAAKLPDWKHPIPEPNPFNRPLSSPSEKTRAKARAKRKKRG